MDGESKGALVWVPIKEGDALGNVLGDNVGRLYGNWAGDLLGLIETLGMVLELGSEDG